MNDFFFVRDDRSKFRFFTADPPRPPDVRRTKAQAAWDLAKRKLMVLPQRILRQEQAFARALKTGEREVRVLYSGAREETHIGLRFRLFLLKRRTTRIFILLGETLLLPFTALTMPLPGPNVFFYVLALLMITHWQSFRGIHAFLKKEYTFAEAPLLAEWEEAVKAGNETAYLSLLARMETEWGLTDLRKILWK
ncbi:MAG: hypothetical protein ABSA30_01630 [Candidatus Aminicenantales bacterium]|jgi:hypothetical protein